MNAILHLIDQWNSSRLELFKITIPDKNLKFFGVMRFFYETPDKYQTKCLRVSSEMKVKDIIPILLEKFYISSNLKSINSFKLYERSSCQDKLLDSVDIPLIIQLLWCKDDKEGIFVLKKLNNQLDTNSRNSKPVRKKEKFVSNSCLNPNSSGRCLEKVCSENSLKLTKKMSKSPSLMSATSLFSRTISNPESLMRLKRKSKLEEKLNQIYKSGNVNAGGTLKIYGESLNSLIPYKSLLLSIDDTAAFVVREILDKYGLENEDENDYCLVKCKYKESNSQQIESEEILENLDSPLKILLQFHQNSSFIRFKVMRCPPNLRRQRKLKVKCATPDVCKGNIKTFPAKKSDPCHDSINDKICYSNDISKERSIKSNNKTNDANNKIYSTPPSSETPLQMVRHESVKRPLPSYEESLSALRSWQVKNIKQPYDSKAISHIDSTDSFSLSSDYQEGSSYNTDSCGSHNLPMIGSSDHTDSEVGIISDLDSHLSRHLPVQITYFKSKEDLLLDSILLEIKPSQMKFKLASAYVLHLMVVDIIRLTCINKATVVDQEMVISMFIDKVASKIRQSIMQNRTILSIQAYWLANCTEFLHLLKSNILLSKFNRSYFDKYYDLFADNAQWCFQCISFGFTDDIANTLSVLLMKDSDDSDDKDDYPLSIKVTEPKTMSDLIRTISSCMTVLQQCYVNPALIIQIISRIFHLINCWIFNTVIENPVYLTRNWGRTLHNRLERIRKWSERHDLLLAADCYFQQSIQVCKLLLLEKNDIEILYNETVDMVDINSIQLRYLLENYNYSSNECRIPQIWIDFVVSGANQVADKVFEEEGIEIVLKEKENLNLPLLLPEDGYHVDSLYGGIPVGFIECLDKLHKEWCFYKISHQDIYFDWLCQKKIYQEESTDILLRNQSIVAVPDTQEKQSNKTYPINRHQLKLSDFKGNIYSANSDNNNDSVDESGIETYKNQNDFDGVYNNEANTYFPRAKMSDNFELSRNNWAKSFSDTTYSTTAASLVSEMMDDDEPHSSHSKRSKVIEEMRKSVERNNDQKIIVQEQIQSEIKDTSVVHSAPNRFWNNSETFLENIADNKSKVNFPGSNEKTYGKSVAQKDKGFLKPSERKKNSYQIDSDLELIDKFSFLKSSTLPTRSLNCGSNPPVSFVPASLALRNSLNYPPRTKPKPRVNNFSINNRSNSVSYISKFDSSLERSQLKPRSLSNDRFYSRMSDGMENLSFQEKVQLFEFAINRSSH